MAENIVIIGGGAGGMTTATQIRRQSSDASITLFEKGSYVSWAGCPTPYFISGRLPKKSVVHFTPEYFKNNRNIDVYTKHEVTSIDTDKKVIYVQGQEISGEFPYDTLVLSLGADVALPPIEGLNLKIPGIFKLRNASDAFTIREFINQNKPQSAIVLGGGYIGMEIAENLAHLGIKVTVVEIADQVLPFVEEPSQRKKLLSLFKENGVQILTQTKTTKILSEPSFKGILLEDGQTISADILVVSTGIRPNTQILQSTPIQMDKGFVLTDEYLETNIKDVYALGDTILTKHLLLDTLIYAPFGDVADKQGLALGNTLTENPVPFKGVIGSTASSFFGWQIAKTGLNIKQATEQEFQVSSVTAKAVTQVPGFGKEPGSFTLIYDTKSMQILGASVLAVESAAPLIDQVAILIANQAKVDQLFEIDYAYSPSTSVVWNPLLAAYRKIFKR